MVDQRPMEDRRQKRQLVLGLREVDVPRLPLRTFVALSTTMHGPQWVIVSDNQRTIDGSYLRQESSLGELSGRRSRVSTVQQECYSSDLYCDLLTHDAPAYGSSS
jgi:hypothetical protein